MARGRVVGSAARRWWKLADRLVELALLHLAITQTGDLHKSLNAIGDARIGLLLSTSTAVWTETAPLCYRWRHLWARCNGAGCRRCQSARPRAVAQAHLMDRVRVLEAPSSASCGSLLLLVRFLAPMAAEQ